MYNNTSKQPKQQDISYKNELANQNNPISRWAQSVELSPFTPDLEVNLPYINKIDLNLLQKPTVFISSPIGSGKTELNKQLIRQLKGKGNNPTILYVTHRKALLQYTAQLIGIDYCISNPDKDDQKRTLTRMSQILISIEDLYLLDARAFDYVFIDDFEHAMHHLCYSTANGKQSKQNLKSLIHSVKTATKLIISGSHLTDKFVDFVKVHRTKPSIAIKNTYIKHKGALTFHQHATMLVHCAIERVKNSDAPVVLMTNSKRKTEELDGLFTSLFGRNNVITISSNNSAHHKIRFFIQNMDTEILKKSVIIISPTLGTTINIQARVAGVYGLFTANTWQDATTIEQHILRCRNADEYQVYVQPRFDGTEETDADVCYALYLNANRGTSVRAGFDKVCMVSDNEIDRKLLKLQALYKTERAKHRNNLFSYTVTGLEQEGFTVTYDDREEKNISEQLKKIRVVLKLEKKIKTSTLSPISPQKFNELLHAGKVTQETHYQLLRYKIEKTSGQSITPETFDLLHTHQKRADFNRLLDIFTPKYQLKQRDIQESKSGVSIISRGHYMKSTRLLRGAIETVFGKEWQLSGEELSKKEIENRLKDYIEEHCEEIRLYIDKRSDLSSNLVAIFRRLLKRVALKLSYKRKRHNNELFYVYFLDRAHLERMHELARVALEARDVKHAVPKHDNKLSNVHVLEQQDVCMSKNLSKMIKDADFKHNKRRIAVV